VVVNPSDFVNQPPSFTVGPPRSGEDENGLRTLTGGATAISAGGPGEEQQTLTFLIETTADHLFAVRPEISSSGVLTFDPAPNVFGTAVVTVRLKDSGGTANGGSDTSPPQTFNITITKPHLWHNAKLPLDVTGDNNIVAADALAVINYINAFKSGPVPAGSTIGPEFLDVAPDNIIAPNDILEIINFINAFGPFLGGVSSGEGEAAAASVHEPDSESAALVASDLLSLLAADLDSVQRRRGKS
jgi:hypothetical protein